MCRAPAGIEPRAEYLERLGASSAGRATAAAIAPGTISMSDDEILECQAYARPPARRWLHSSAEQAYAGEVATRPVEARYEADLDPHQIKESKYSEIVLCVIAITSTRSVTSYFPHSAGRTLASQSQVKGGPHAHCFAYRGAA
jgi:hypothetical protein